MSSTIGPPITASASRTATIRAHQGIGVPALRPALAVKVENLPESRPQTGLGAADIVFEEPVEAESLRPLQRQRVTAAHHRAKGQGPLGQ